MHDVQTNMRESRGVKQRFVDRIYKATKIFRVVEMLLYSSSSVRQKRIVRGSHADYHSHYIQIE